MKSFQKNVIQAAILALVVALPNVVLAKNNHATSINDTAIVAAIKIKQATEPLVDPFHVSVEAHNGNVKLKGFVKTNVQYETAVMQAASIENVHDIDAHGLKVQDSQQPLTDTLITAKIKGKLIQAELFKDANIDSWGITVETKNGEVYLVGKVDTNEKKSNILKLAKNIRNVKSVNASGLTVSVE